MTVAETTNKQVFYGVVERYARVRHTIAVKATTKEEAQQLILAGEGLDAGFLGADYSVGDPSVLYVTDEVPLGAQEVEGRFL
jgi:hypothetical protein